MATADDIFMSCW